MDDATDAESMEGCTMAGCDLPATGHCTHCKSAGYCGVDHSIKDYGRHVQHECVSCIQHAPGAVMWGVEVEVGQSHGAKEPDWEPADLVHGRVDERGLVTSFVSNRDLLAKIQDPVNADGFAAQEIFPGSRSNTVTAGRRRTEITPTWVWLSIASGSGRNVNREIPVNLPKHDVSRPGGRGTTVHVDKGDIHRDENVSSVRQHGSVVVGLRIGQDSWQIWGAYDLAEREGTDLPVRAYKAVRKGTTRLMRRALGHDNVVRIHGKTEDGVEASVTFRRTDDDVYQVQSLSIHVPEFGGRSDTSKGWLSAKDVNSNPGDADSSGEAAGRAQQLMKVLRETEGEEEEEEGPEPPEREEQMMARVDADISTSVTLARPDPENRVHVASLINIVAAQHQQLKQAFLEEELTADPVEVKRLQIQLNEMSRLRSVLETHMGALAAEASGEKELENISADVHAAMGKATELIGIEAGAWWNRRRRTAKLRSAARRMNGPDAKKAFIQAVDDASQGLEGVGSEFRTRARFYLERLKELHLHNDPDVKDAEFKLNNLRDTESSRKKNKHHRAKQRSDRTLAEQDERDARGE